ncbi:YfiR family protein [Duganella sp. BuS-21]|uniref:YfiR family protein n=1 Tax=Duganella sp. BuS-21 TaxID=2943848 RepID=UPI0035A597ED
MTPIGKTPRPAARHRVLALARAVALACGLAAVAAPLTQAAAASEVASVERNVKAAFLYKFLSYVEYPAGLLAPDAPYVIGVTNADDVAAELVRITEGRNVNNHPLQVRVLRSGDSVAGLHLLFIGASESAQATSWLRSAQKASVLSVTETPDALQLGSVINFRLVDNRVRFEVSVDAAEKSNVKLSSRLLSVAYAVQKGGS